MGKASREKGRKFEQLICRLAREAGLDAERRAPLQAGKFGCHGDIEIAGLKVECKHRDCIPQWKQITSGEMFTPGKTLLDWLSDGPCIVRKTGQKPYIIAQPTGLSFTTCAKPLDDWLAAMHLQHGAQP